MKQKALFFLQSNCGGAERMTIHIAGCLDESKYEVIFYIIGKDYGVIKQFIPASNSCHLIQVESFRDFLTSKLFRVLRKEKPEFVFSSTFPINYRLCIASVFSPKTRVILRSSNYLYTQTFLQKSRLFFAYRFLDYLITQTEEMRNEHINKLYLKESKVVTYANPIDKTMIESKLKGCASPFGGDKINYVYVGRISLVKGLDILVLAFSKLLQQNPNLILYIVGETGGVFKAYYNKLLLLIDDLKIAEKIIFTGFSDNPYKYMKYADCLVLPSRNEGLPNVVIESLYLGTPVAVTNCIPVMNRIVRDNINGCITEVESVDGLVNAMECAVKLGRVVSSYSSASKEDFQKLFV